MNFLFVNFILSQPNTLDKLITNFKNFLFPFYIFIIKPEASNKNANYSVLDFTKFQICFYKKSKLIRGITGETIKLLSIQKDSIKIILKNSNEILSFKCGIQQQSELVYVLLLYLMQSSDRFTDVSRTEKNLNITYTNIDSENALPTIENEKYLDIVNKLRYYISILLVVD